jgi:tetratricopeptide (TPR) repeat protein
LVYFGLTHHWEAAAALEKAVQLDPGFDLARFFLGTILLAKGDLEQAESYFKSAIALNPRNAWYYSYLMRVYQRKGSEFSSAALENARKAVALNPNDVDSRLELAKWEIGQQNLTQARRILEDLVHSSPEFVPGRFALARVYTRLNLKEQAEEQTKAIVELENRSRWSPTQELHYLEQSMFFLSSGRLTDALTVLDQAAVRLPVSYRLAMMRGLVAIFGKRFTEAIESYGLAARLNPNSAEANYSLAVAQRAQAHIPDAAATLERGIRLFPSDALHYQEYASLLHFYADSKDGYKRDRVVSLLKKALELDPNLGESNCLLGQILLQEGHGEEAVPYLESASKLNPGSSKPHSLLARAYRSQGRTAEAMRETELFQKSKGEEQKDEQAARLLQLAER